MKTCSLCQARFDPTSRTADPATEAGLFLARELYDDADDVCPRCLTNRGTLGMMYCREFKD